MTLLLWCSDLCRCLMRYLEGATRKLRPVVIRKQSPMLLSECSATRRNQAPLHYHTRTFPDFCQPPKQQFSLVYHLQITYYLRPPTLKMADVPSHLTPRPRDGHLIQPGVSNAHRHSSSYLPPRASSPTRPETFLCTFCWRPQRCGPVNSSNAPRVVGRHARLACEPCYNALLDLAIC